MLFAAISLLLLLVGVNFWVAGSHVKTNRRIDNISEGFTEFFTSQDKDGYTNFAKTVSWTSEAIGQSVGRYFVAAERGASGGTMKGVNKELERVAVQENPELAVLDVLPKSLKRNPLAMLGLQAIMSKQRGSNIIPSQINGSSQQVKFDL